MLLGIFFIFPRLRPFIHVALRPRHARVRSPERERERDAARVTRARLRIRAFRMRLL